MELGRKVQQAHPLRLDWALDEKRPASRRYGHEKAEMREALFLLWNVPCTKLKGERGPWRRSGATQQMARNCLTHRGLMCRAF